MNKIISLLSLNSHWLFISPSKSQSPSAAYSVDTLPPPVPSLTSCPATVPSLTLIQPHWPPCSIVLTTLLPQGLCNCFSFHLGSPPRFHMTKADSVICGVQCRNENVGLLIQRAVEKKVSLKVSKYKRFSFLPRERLSLDLSRSF